MDKLLTKQLLLTNNYWVLNKSMVQLLGLEGAFLLSNFAEAESMMADDDGWFYQTSDTVEEITTLSRHKQDQAIKKMKDLGVLEQSNRGVPPKRYFKINYECLTNQFVKYSQIELSKINKSNCQKSATNKESSYKESNHKESTTSTTTLKANDIDQIIEEWNKLDLQNLQAINSNTNRYTMLKARIREYSLDEVMQAIRSIKDSSFLQGQNNRNWTITFDWLVRPNNFLKVLEGNYIDKEVSSSGRNNSNFKQTKGSTTEVGDDIAERAGVISL